MTGTGRLFTLVALAVVVVILLLGLLLFRPPAAKKMPGPWRIVCLGDSLTESEFGSYPKHLRRLLRRQRIPATVISLARPGNTSGEYLEFLRRDGTLRRYHPDLMLLMLGTNDCRCDGDHTATVDFVRHMEEILEILDRVKTRHGQAPMVFLATIPPIPRIDGRVYCPESPQRAAAEINPAIRQLAERHRAIVVDIHAFFEQNSQLLPGVHPSGDGYQKMAGEFLHAIHPRLDAASGG